MDVEETHSRVSFASILGKSVEATFAEGPLTSERGALLLRAVIEKWGAAPGVVSHGLRLRRCDHCLVGSTVLLFGAGLSAFERGTEWMNEQFNRLQNPRPKGQPGVVTPSRPKCHTLT